jgi:hypothetical protein
MELTRRTTEDGARQCAVEFATSIQDTLQKVAEVSADTTMTPFHPHQNQKSMQDFLFLPFPKFCFRGFITLFQLFHTPCKVRKLSSR